MGGHWPGCGVAANPMTLARTRMTMTTASATRRTGQDHADGGAGQRPAAGRALGARARMRPRWRGPAAETISQQARPDRDLGGAVQAARRDPWRSAASRTRPRRRSTDGGSGGSGRSRWASATTSAVPVNGSMRRPGTRRRPSPARTGRWPAWPAPRHSLGREVTWRPYQFPGGRDRRRADRVRDAEVRDLDDAAGSEQQVGRLDVAVDQPGGVRGLQPGRGLGDDIHGLAGVQRAAGQHSLPGRARSTSSITRYGGRPAAGSP